MNKIWIVYMNNPYEFSQPIAAFSSKDLAIDWIEKGDTRDMPHGIQE